MFTIVLVEALGHTHVGHWKYLCPDFILNIFFNHFINTDAWKKKNIIKYVPSLEICHFC